MLNYIWVGLILIGILVAVGTDIRDEIQNPYRNGTEMTAAFEVRIPPGSGRTTWEGDVLIDEAAFNAFYGDRRATGPVRQRSVLSESPAGSLLTMTMDDASPAWWREMAKWGSVKDRLMANVTSSRLDEATGTRVIRFTIEPIRFVKLRAVSQAAIDYAATAVNIALGLIGVMALWLGVVKVAEAAGMLQVLTRVLAPVTRRVFPDIPPDHPAVASIIMNIAANMLGLSNAATPFGLKAMEELNKLNPKAGVASNAMVTFLAINTGGLILIPATAIAVRAAAGSANPGIIIGTSVIGATAATIAGVAASKILQRLPRYKKAMEVDHE